MAAAEFDSAKAYAAKESVGDFFDDGREIELLHYIYGRPDIDQLRGNPRRILAAIDDYGRTRKFLMNVGEDKGRIVTDLIAQEKPKVMVELGGYVGYSCILFASTLLATSGPSARYYTLERNPEFGAVILSLTALAGLSPAVSVVIGASSDSLLRLRDEAAFPDGIDMLFLDHYKPAYTPDLKLLEELGLIVPGRTLLCADNVVDPGNPPYLDYVRASVAEKRGRAEEARRAALAAAAKTGPDGRGAAAAERTHVGVDGRFPPGSADQYRKREAAERLDTTRIGDPNLVYDSRLVMSFEPTGTPDGIEISRCVRREEPEPEPEPERS